MNKKEEIAQDFINLHKNSDIVDWLYSGRSLEDVYNMMEFGSFGTVHDNNGVLSIEISPFESASGRPVIFEWEPVND